MSRTGRLAPLAAAFALAASGCEQVGIPHVDLERMIDQTKLEPYEASEYFPQFLGLREPPPGTVPRGAPLATPGVTTGRDPGGRFVATFPVPLTLELLARGRDGYDVYCAPCHGVAGAGQTRVAEAMTLRPPPSLVDPPVRSYPVGRIFEAQSQGFGLMPSYAEELSVLDRWAVTAYVRALQLRHGVPLDELPPPLRAEAEEALR